MTITTYTVNATINVGGTYNASQFMLGDIFPNETQELIPLLTDKQVQSLSFPSDKIGFKVYDITLPCMYVWDGSEWVESNNYVASTLVANTSTGQTLIDISTTNPPNAGQALVAISATKAAWSNISGGGGSNPSYNSSFVGTIGDGITQAITVNHGLGTENVLVGVWEASGPMIEVDCSITIVDSNNITFGFTTPPPLNSIKVIIVSSASTNIVPNGLPSQTGFGGDFLTTNGTSASWTAVTIPSALPDQYEQTGNYLSTNGSNTLWSSPLPSITGQSGNVLTTDGLTTLWASALPTISGTTTNLFLTNNGTVASWNAITTLPSQTGNSGLFLTTNGSTTSWASPLPTLPGVARYLYTDGTTVSWAVVTALVNPMTTAGDLIVGGASGATGRLGIGSVGQSLTVISSTTLGWTTILPAMSGGTNGEFLTNNGSTTNWAAINQVPTMSGGTNGQVLSNNGTISLWITNTSPPSVSGQAGNFLTNNGTIVSWSPISQVPSVSGKAGEYLTNDGSSYFWTVLTALTNPMTTAGDIIVGGTSGVAARLGIGSIGQVLTVYNSTTVAWETPFISPMTAYGDLIIGGAAGAPIKLTVGSIGQVLTVYDTGLGHYSLEWLSGLTNPMTSVGDIIYGTTAGGLARLGIGSAGTVLTSVSGIPAWTTIIPPISGGTNGEFLTNNGSTASWGTIPSQLPSQVGFNGDYLTTNGSTASWASIPSGFTNPMTAAGDMISATSGGTPAKLSIGTSGQVLTVVSGGPSWQTLTLPTGLPSQTGFGGYFLTTNGTTASWYQLTQLVPVVSGGTSGYFLGNNGTTFSWMSLPNQLPSLTGQSGKYLSTDGSTTFWNPITTIPSITGNSGKILSTDGVTVYWVSESSVASLGTLPFTYTSSSLAVNAQEIDTASTACYAFQLMTISVSGPCRVRFYGTSATATADLSRLSSTAPVGNVGLFAEFVFISTALSWICSPAIFCFNNDTVINQNIYITIQNTGASTTAITVNATILKME